MPYNFVADSFHTKKLYSRLSSSEVRFYTKNGLFAFLIPLWGLRGDDHLRLIGKHVVDILLVLRRYERVPVQNRRFRSNGGPLTQNFR